jgi:transcriptional regulator with XRE-family HTH domain
MDHPIVARFGANLKRARESAGLTQEDLHGRGAAHATQISRMENQGLDVPISTVARLAVALEITPGQLLDGTFGP